ADAVRRSDGAGRAVRGARHGGLRPALPRPARARGLRRPQPVRVPVPVAGARRRRDRRDHRRRVRLLRRRLVDLFAEIAEGAVAESSVWAAALLPEHRRQPVAVFSPLAPSELALGLETVYAAYLT